MPTPITASFDEIRAVARHVVPGAAHGVAGDGLAAFVASVRPDGLLIDPPRIAVFAARHGVSADLPEGALDRVEADIEALMTGAADMKAVIEQIGGELKLYELAIERPTRDFRLGPAMSELETCRAAAYGMMAVEPGVGALAISSLGGGGDIAAAALGCALLRTVDPPGGASGARIAAGLARVADETDPLALLAELGGPDIAAMLGVILAAGLARTPVILDGIAAHAAGLVAEALRPGATRHCRAATSVTPGPVALARHLPGPAATTIRDPAPEAGVNVLKSMIDACGALAGEDHSPS
jgi:nicotinate-nucleotide--dimethylbenzimidazole phosphoribosyltransferase